jgi:DNA polymerase III delta subunit
MLIFLYGPDDYRRSQKKRELIAEFTKKRSELGLRHFDFLVTGARDEFDEFARTESLFVPARLAVLENAFELEPSALAKILKPFVAGDKKNTSPSGLTILLSERDKPVKALAFLLEKPTIAQKFEVLAGAEWISFIGAEAKKIGLRLALPAAQFLATVYQGNSWALATELAKLAVWKPTIERRDLDAFDLEVAPNYWGLLNGMKSFDMRIRLATLEQLFALSDPPAKIFNILAAQAGQKGTEALQKFAEFDFAVKSGKLEYEETLVDLALGN